VKTGQTSLAESSKEGYGSKSAVLPNMMMMMMMMSFIQISFPERIPSGVLSSTLGVRKGKFVPVRSREDP
jgi:hypothetical protein